jgi:putative ABC transport system permease protein
MNLLAWKDIRFNLLRFFLASVGVGFLLTGTMGVTGLYRGIVHDALAIIEDIDAELWIVQGGKAGPFAEGSAVSPVLDRRLEGVPGIRSVRRFIQYNQQFTFGGRFVRIAVTGLDFPRDHGEWLRLSRGRLIGAAHFEAIADEGLGFQPGDVVRLGHDDYTIVGTVGGVVDMSGDSALFVTIPDALDIADARPSEAVLLDRALKVGSTADHPTRISAVIAVVASEADAAFAKNTLSRWGDVSVFTRDDQRSLLLDGRLWRLRMQILFFVFLLFAVTAVVIAMTIYNSTVEKLHQIAMLKLLGARDRFILSVIVQQALLISVIAFAVALVLGQLIFPYFPRKLVLLPSDLIAMFVGQLGLSLLGSLFGIVKALNVRAQEVLS